MIVALFMATQIGACQPAAQPSTAVESYQAVENLVGAINDGDGDIAAQLFTEDAMVANHFSGITTTA